MYDIYGGKGAAGLPVLIKEEKERKSEDFRKGEIQFLCNNNVLLEYNLTGKEALCSGQAQLLPSM